MFVSRILSKSSQRLKRFTFLQRLAGTRLGRAVAGFPSRRHDARSVTKDTIYAQRLQNSSTVDVVLVSSNGAGLGHLTRLEAINRQLTCSTMIYTLSKGFRRLEKRADELVYFPSSATLDLSSSTWNPLFFGHFSAFIATTNPKVIVFDGTFLYAPVVETSKALGVPLVWIRRGRWKDNVRSRSIQFNSPEKFCDLVIVPGEYANTDSISTSSSVENVAPVVVHEQIELLTRQAALEGFALSSVKKYVLVQLGAGNINDIDDWVSAACDAILSLGEEWVPVLLSNPLSSDRQLPSKAVIIKAFPISLYLNAFEFVLIAAGYNSVQEAIAAEIPFITVPNLKTATDDQLRRALAIDEAGLGIAVSQLADLRSAIHKLASPMIRDQMRRIQSSGQKPDGARQIAHILCERYGI